MWMGLLLSCGPLMAQLPEEGAQLLEGAATADDEIVLGTDGWQVVVLALEGQSAVWQEGGAGADARRQAVMSVRRVVGLEEPQGLAQHPLPGVRPG